MSTVHTPYESSRDLLGEIVTWHMRSAEVPLTKIRDALTNAGLDPDVAKDLNNRAAFSRAAKHLKENRSIDKVHESKDGKIQFQLTRKAVDQSGHSHVMKFDYETQITLDSKTGDIYCGNAHIEDQAKELFAHAMNHRTSSDLTRLVQKLFKDNADLFPINPQKGVAYFVPEQHKDFTEKVEKFFTACGGSIDCWPVPKGTEKGNRSVREAVNRGLESLANELEEAADLWDDDTRADTMTRALKKFKTIQHKVESYSEYLQYSKQNLDDKLKELKAKLVEKAQAKSESLKSQDPVAA